MTRTHKIAVLPGDGIGKEIMPNAMRVLQRRHREATVTWRLRPSPGAANTTWRPASSCRPMASTFCASFDAIYFVAAGHPGVIDFRVGAGSSSSPCASSSSSTSTSAPSGPARACRPCWPISPMRSISSSCARTARANTPGPGGVVHDGHPNELAIQTNVFTRTGVERIARYAFDLARTRRERVHQRDQVQRHAPRLVFWDKIVAEVAAGLPRRRVRDALRGRRHHEVPAATRAGSTSSSPPTCSATFSAIWAAPWSAASVWPRAPISTRSETSPPCSSRSTAPHRTSRAGASPTPPPRFWPVP